MIANELFILRTVVVFIDNSTGSLTISFINPRTINFPKFLSNSPVHCIEKLL
jgi:hypothetical protein